MLKNIKIIAYKELKILFSTPVAYVSLISYIVLSGVFMFYLGSFFQTGQADMNIFFSFQPWIFLFFISSLTMKVYSDEIKSGTNEVLYTLPFSNIDIVVGKMLGIWLFVLFSIMCTFSIWISINVLGDVDNLMVISGYIGNILVATLFISIGLFVSSLTKNQIISFVATILICLIYLFSGTKLVLDFMQNISYFLSDIVSSMSVMFHFELFKQGLIEFSSLIFFVGSIMFWMVLNLIVIKNNKG
jgi:ABC-2 type transport system permease protein